MPNNKTSEPIRKHGMPLIGAFSCGLTSNAEGLCIMRAGNSDEKIDAIIVGAGPAGCLLAVNVFLAGAGFFPTCGATDICPARSGLAPRRAETAQPVGGRLAGAGRLVRKAGWRDAALPAVMTMRPQVN